MRRHIFIYIFLLSFLIQLPTSSNLATASQKPEILIGSTNWSKTAFYNNHLSVQKGFSPSRYHHHHKPPQEIDFVGTISNCATMVGASLLAQCKHNFKFADRIGATISSPLRGEDKACPFWATARGEGKIAHCVAAIPIYRDGYP